MIATTISSSMSVKPACPRRTVGPLSRRARLALRDRVVKDAAVVPRLKTILNYKLTDRLRQTTDKAWRRNLSEADENRQSWPVRIGRRTARLKVQLGTTAECLPDPPATTT